jgi:pimeloyl-ACP methyl ester carboxylesterase
MSAKLSLAERDRRIRDAEQRTYEHFGMFPVERYLEVTAEGRQVSIRLTVFGSPGDQPPILLLHGITSATVLAAPLVPHLSQRQIIAVDWPGHGLSGASLLGPTTPFRTYAADVMRGILDALDVPVVDIVGHSLGGQIALYSALDLPSRVRRVALLGAPGASLEGTRPLAVMKLLALPKIGARLLSIPQSDKMFQAANDMALGVGALDAAPPAMVEALKLIGGRAANAASIASFFRGLIRGSHLRAGVTLSGEDLGRIRHAVLFAWGDRDVFLAPTNAASSIVAIHDTHLVRVPGAGHAPWLQAPERVGSAVAAHLGLDLNGQTITINNRTVQSSSEPEVAPR